jgi:hypothetical protein
MIIRPMKRLHLDMVYGQQTVQSNEVQHAQECVVEEQRSPARDVDCVSALVLVSAGLGGTYPLAILVYQDLFVLPRIFEELACSPESRNVIGAGCGQVGVDRGVD